MSKEILTANEVHAGKPIAAYAALSENFYCCAGFAVAVGVVTAKNRAVPVIYETVADWLMSVGYVSSSSSQNGTHLCCCRLALLSFFYWCCQTLSVRFIALYSTLLDFI